MTLHSLTCSERVVLNGKYVRAIVPLQCRRARFDPWVGKIPWKRKWQPTPEFSPGESWTEEPGGLQSMGPQRVKHDLVTDTTRALCC